MNQWILAGTAFAASAVEFVEAATIVLAVGYAQGWRAALGGTAAASAVLLALIAVLGPLLASVASLHRIELVAGPFLILFGTSWLRKAVWRYAGRKAMRDESAAYERERALLEAERERRRGFAVAFQGVFVEGLEVAAIVITFAASRAGGLLWAFGGASVALAGVCAAAFVLRKPFAQVPENALKAFVGTMLLTLGTFWTGEGLGLQWWLGDATIFAIAGLFAIVAATMTVALRAGGSTA